MAANSGMNGHAESIAAGELITKDPIAPKTTRIDSDTATRPMFVSQSDEVQCTRSTHNKAPSPVISAHNSTTGCEKACYQSENWREGDEQEVTVTWGARGAIGVMAAALELENLQLLHEGQSAAASRTVSNEMGSARRSKPAEPALYSRQTLRPLGLRSRKVGSAARAAVSDLVGTKKAPAVLSSSLDLEDHPSNTPNILLDPVTNAGPFPIIPDRPGSPQGRQPSADDHTGDRRSALGTLEQEHSTSNSARLRGWEVNDAVTSIVLRPREKSGKRYFDVQTF